LQLVARILADHAHLELHGLLRRAMATERPLAIATTVRFRRVLHVLIVVSALGLLDLCRSAQYTLLLLLQLRLI
jgi:hypothetical protein